MQETRRTMFGTEALSNKTRHRLSDNLRCFKLQRHFNVLIRASCKHIERWTGASTEVYKLLVMKPYWLVCVVGSTPTQYSRGSGFISRPGHRLSWQVYRSFLRPSRCLHSISNYAAITLCLILYNSLFTNHHIIQHYILWASNRVVSKYEI
jgi:hypothetical protein